MHRRGIYLARAFQGACGAGGDAGVSAPVRTSDFIVRFIRLKRAVNNQGNGQYPGAFVGNLPGVEQGVLAEGPKAGPGRSYTVGEVEGDL